ncbi:MAG: Mur ligase family protein, partial [Candidatus Geothermincolales bacterium]
MSVEKDREVKLADLVEGLAPLRLTGDPHVFITGLAYHSGLVRPGDLFAAIEGFVRDGHDFIPEALRRGAAALLVREGREPAPEVARGVPVISSPDTRLALALLSDRFYGHPSGELQLVGVTGTNGKTTTAFLVEKMAAAQGLKTGLLGTVTYRIGDREYPVGRTTPESVDLQRLLREMADEGCRLASMEVSSHSLVLRRVDGCDFRVAVFTNLTRDHLDFHRSMEDYFSS